MKEFLGLVVLALPLTLMIIILIALVLATTLFSAKAARKGKSAWGWGLLGFLVVFLPIFWDWIPTVVAHKYYCATEAGFWVYKTPEQWKKENPGVMETLTTQKNPPHEFVGDENNSTNTTFWNDRIKTIHISEGPIFLHRWKREDELIDIKTNERLARYVDFSASQQRREPGWSGWKFWLDSRFCSGGEGKAMEYVKLVGQLKGAVE